MARLTLTDMKLRDMMNSRGAPDFSTLDYTAPDFDVRYGLALNWVHQAAEPEELVKESQAYLTNAGRAQDALLVKHVPFGVQQTMGKISYCLNRGAQLSPKSHTYIDNALKQSKPQAEMEAVVLTASGKLIEAYVDCYSRIDNLKTLFLKGKMDIKDFPTEIEKILEKHGHPKVLARLQAHYADSLVEAQSDKLIQAWQKPLKAIVKALGSKAEQPVAPKTPKMVKTSKLAKLAKKSKIKMAKSAPPKEKAAGPSVASQVRDLIRAHKDKLDEAGMVELVIKTLGLNTARGKSVVKAFWGKV